MGVLEYAKMPENKKIHNEYENDKAQINLRKTNFLFHGSLLNLIRQ